MNATLHLSSSAVTHAAARTARSRLTAQLIAAAANAIAATMRALIARHRQRRFAYDTARALQSLDARTLRDIGLDRSEIPSIAAELSGATAGNRVRLMQI